MHLPVEDPATGAADALTSIQKGDQSTLPDDSTNSIRVLVIDSDDALRTNIADHLASDGYTVTTADTVGKAIGQLHSDTVQAVLVEISPETGPAFDDVLLLRELTQCPCVIATSSDASPRVVVESMRHGAADFLPKPFELGDVSAMLRRVLSGVGIFSQNQAPARSNDAPTMLLGVGAAIQDVRKIAHRAAKTDLNCLIRGESGVGKDVVAREIHRLSQRHDMPFIKVNCSALPELLLESELFGYEKGAFTGADRAKPGRFSLAHGGIIFLDEIGDMDPGLQAKILQVIEHKEFTKLGGREPQKVDTQIIAATNSNLEEKIARGIFRQDLFFRLNEISIVVPTLRDRREDIPTLIEHFIRKHAHCAAGSRRHLSADELDRLVASDWPGNIRELENTIKRWLAVGMLNIAPERGSAEFQISPLTSSPKPVDAPAPSSSAEAATPQFIYETLEKYQWNRRETARALGIGYSTLRRAIQKYDLDRRPYEKA